MAELELTKAQWAALEVLVAKRDLVHGGHARSQMDPPTVNSLAAHALCMKGLARASNRSFMTTTYFEATEAGVAAWLKHG